MCVSPEPLGFPPTQLTEASAEKRALGLEHLRLSVTFPHWETLGIII